MNSKEAEVYEQDRMTAAGGEEFQRNGAKTAGGEAMYNTLVAQFKRTPVHCYEYPLRPNFMAQAVLPRNLTEQEAKRLCAFIMTLAQP